jgi:hypothetical protein
MYILKKFLKIFFKIIIIFSIILSFVILSIFVINKLKDPQLNKEWAEDSKILPSIQIENNIVTISNIRDWRYGHQEVISNTYFTDVFDVEKIKNTYLLFNPFGDWEGVGHFWFVFEFEDNKTISVSVEARREKDESYSAIRGLFNTYELWYSFGSVQDHITRRVVYHNEDVYKYPLLISQESSKALFLEMVYDAQQLETQPRFYNTVSSNCTNILADAANRVQKGSIPLHYSRVFTGFSDNQLYDLKFIPHDKPFEQIYEEAYINEKVIKENSVSNEDFWISLFK